MLAPGEIQMLKKAPAAAPKQELPEKVASGA
jgi:hypothetical protein